VSDDNSPEDARDDPDVSDVMDQLDDLRESIDPEADLEPMSPRDAREDWLDRQEEKADSTIRSYEDRTVHFIRFCDREGIDDLNDLTTRHIKQYESERLSKEITESTQKNEWGTLGRMLEHAAKLNAVLPEVAEALDVPELSKDERVNTETLPAQRALTILQNLERYEYGSREHVSFMLIWRTTMRLGAIHGLDLRDLYLEEDDLGRLRRQLLEDGYTPAVVDDVIDQAETPFIYPRHRPESGTTLKNGVDGERVINISDDTAEVLEAYIRVNRHEIEDDQGRKPLLTSKKGGGRLADTSIRNWMYILTQPCNWGDECPHDRDPEECVAREHGRGSKCPSARSPHKIRTGSYTWHRDKGWPRRDLEEKANTSLDEVYDQPFELTRGMSRRQHLDRLNDNGGDSA